MRDVVYAFIDSQNLNLGVQNAARDRRGILHPGWRLDFTKFRRYLNDKYRVRTAFLFIGFKPDNENLYRYLRRAGYTVILKPTTTFTNKEGHKTTKGNVDADLVLYAAAKEFKNYDKAVIVSGDGDFLSLYQFLDENNKLQKLVIPNKLRYSQLLPPFSKYFDFISSSRRELELTNKKDGYNPERRTNRVTRHRD